MAVLTFPAPNLTPDDEAVIMAHVRAGGVYGCRPETTSDGQAAIALLNTTLEVRGRVTKRHGIYAVLDAHGHAVLRSRHLPEVLAALAK